MSKEYCELRDILVKFSELYMHTIDAVPDDELPWLYQMVASRAAIVKDEALRRRAKHNEKEI